MQNFPGSVQDKNVYTNDITQAISHAPWAILLRMLAFSVARQLFDFAALLSQRISDWAPVRAHCVWELPVCNQLRRRQPQPQDQCDPSEPLQQLRLPGGDAGRPGSRSARVPPEAPTSRYSRRHNLALSLTANSSNPCRLITATIAWLLFLCPSLLA